MSGQRTAPGASPPDGITLLSAVARVGVKGAGSAEALDALGLRRPDRPNASVPLVYGGRAAAGRVLRLGNTEYLVEQDDGADVPSGITSRLAGATQAWAVERADAAFLLRADVVARCLPQMTRFDVTTLAREPGALAMTQLAGLSVTLLHDPAAGGLRLWCDAGYAAYLLDCFRSLLAAPPP